MRQSIQYLLITFFVVALAACSMQAPSGNVSDDVNDHVFINITSDIPQNPHSAVMGMHVAQKALKNHMEATLFFNVDGVRLFKDGGDTIQFHGENVYTLLADIIDKGGQVLSCPHCMEVNEVTEADLPEGVLITSDDALVGNLTRKGKALTY
jgi:predicted peroxiredoxin